jgi:hypothetical protein
MPKKLDWVFNKKFKNEKDFHSYLETFPPYATTNNNKVNCNICTDGKSHKMRQLYLLCTSKMCGSKCESKYKIENCLKKSIIKLFSLNDHIFDHNAAEVDEKKYGLTKSMKKLVESLIVEHDIQTTEHILIKLTRMKRKGKVEIIPSKSQLSNYLSYRRKKLGKIHFNSCYYKFLYFHRVIKKETKTI